MSELRGHTLRSRDAIERYRKMKKLYDRNKPLEEILDEIRKPDGSKYSRMTFYKGLRILKTL
jgi:hypothetical protein